MKLHYLAKPHALLSSGAPCAIGLPKACVSLLTIKETSTFLFRLILIFSKKECVQIKLPSLDMANSTWSLMSWRSLIKRKTNHHPGQLKSGVIGRMVLDKSQVWWQKPILKSDWLKDVGNIELIASTRYTFIKCFKKWETTRSEHLSSAWRTLYLVRSEWLLPYMFQVKSFLPGYVWSHFKQIVLKTLTSNQANLNFSWISYPN